MSPTSTLTYTHGHTVTYLAGKLLLSLQLIIQKSGLSPARLIGDWSTYDRGITTWLASGDLQLISIEVFNPHAMALIGRWDLSVEYGADEDGFWFDPDDIAYEIKKCGVWPSTCDYSIKVTNRPGRPDVFGWAPCSFLSTDGMVRQSIGTMISSNGIRASAAYWRNQ